MNDAPSFNVSDNSISVKEDSGEYSAAWASDISAGPGEEQNVTFSTECDNATAALFSVAPSVNASGVLTFTPAEDAFGTSKCTVTLAEVGAGGLTATAGLTVEVTPVNDPPSFKAGNATITVDGDSEAYSADWATAVSAGPREEAQQLSMSIACSNNALFSEPAGRPAIELQGTVGVLSFTPAKTKSGSTTCTVTLAELGQDGLKATADLTIVVADGEAGAQEEGNSCTAHVTACPAHTLLPASI